MIFNGDDLWCAFPQPFIVLEFAPMSLEKGESYSIAGKIGWGIKFGSLAVRVNLFDGLSLK